MSFSLCFRSSSILFCYCFVFNKNGPRQIAMMFLLLLLLLHISLLKESCQWYLFVMVSRHGFPRWFHECVVHVTLVTCTWHAWHSFRLRCRVKSFTQNLQWWFVLSSLHMHSAELSHRTSSLIRDTNWYDIVIVAAVAQTIRAFVKAPLLCILSYPDNTILIKVTLKVVKCKQWRN